LELRGRVFGGYKSRDLDGHLRRNLNSGLRDRGMADMADLAMILVVGMSVSTGDGVGAQHDHRKDECDPEYVSDYIFRHTNSSDL
jgi:hypothetical protein